MSGPTSASERRPLLARVPVSEPAPRYPHARSFRRLVSALLAIVLVFILGQLFFFPDTTPFPRSVVSTVLEWNSGYQWPAAGRVPLNELERIMLTVPQEAQAKEWSRYYTSGPHLAGKNLSQAIWTKERLEEFGIPAEIVTYEIYTNYPVSHRLALFKSRPKADNSGPVTSGHASVGHGDNLDLIFEASLEEPILEQDPTTGLDERIPTFHGYSAKYLIVITR